MKLRKTPKDARKVYVYTREEQDKNGKYITAYDVIRPTGNRKMAFWIMLLHKMDDNEVANNLKHVYPKEHQKRLERDRKKKEGAKKKKDLEEYYGNLPKWIVNPFEDEPDDVLKLREIVENKLTNRQIEAYTLIGLQGYSITDAAKVMGISIKVAKVHYDKAIARIRKNFGENI